MTRASTIQNRWSTEQLITGIETGEWLRLLSINGWAVHPTYLHRAAWVGGLSLGASAAGAVERMRHGSGIDEYGCDENDNVIVRVDSGYFRPTEVETLLGDATKAKEQLGWAPRISFEELVSEMAESDLRLAERDALVQKEGYQAFNHNE